MVHRIVGGDATTSFSMRGDNNSFVDPWKPRPDDVVGRIVLDIPLAGAWGMDLVRPINLGILCGSLTVTALLWPRRDAGRQGTRVSGAHVMPSAGRSRSARAAAFTTQDAMTPTPDRHESSQ